MPSLPRIRTRRVGQPARAEVAPRQPRLAELHGDGLTWIHLDSPTHEEAQQLAERFGWHPLDIEDVLSRRQRPKVDLYSEEPDGYLFAVLHFPVYDTNVGRLNAGELDVFVGPDYLVTLPAVELKPVTRLFERCAALDTYSYAQVTVTARRFTVAMKDAKGQPVREATGVSCAPLVLTAR